MSRDNEMTPEERTRVFEKAVNQMLAGEEVELTLAEQACFTPGDFREALNLVRAIRKGNP